MMKAGERVRHHRYGDGVVISVSHGGVVGVRFKDSTRHVLEGNLLSTDAEIEKQRRQQHELKQREEAARQLRTQLRIRQYIDRGEFTEAVALHARDAATFWPQSSFQAELDNGVARREQAQHALLRQNVGSLLDSWRFDEADSLYRAECAHWWQVADYELLLEQTRNTRKWVQAYIGASLSELDELRIEMFSKLPGEDYAHLKLPKLQVRLARLAMPLDYEQLLACARPERHRLIRARAGSGKTRTLAAHAALTMHDEALEPDQVLILAFNKKAALEIGDRVRGAAGIAEFRNARTFHSLAWKLADHAGRKLIFDDGNLAPSRREQRGFVERLIESIMNPAFRETLYEFFRREVEQLDRLGSNLSKEEYVAFRRSLADYTLSGETVKSNGEKFIADFLFEHGVVHKYERVWSWDKQDRLHGTAYRPDFSIIDGERSIILEHWAIDPSDSFARVPEWWETSTRDYRNQIEAKREYWSKRGVALLETHAGMLARGRVAFEASLKTLLERAGVRCRKLEHNELIRRVAEAPRTVSRMAELFLQFISRAKKRGWSADDMDRILSDAPDPEPRNRAFHELAVHAYGAYQRRLAEQSAMDFDDLLISAAECVRRDGGGASVHLEKSDSIAVRDLRWILIDEFQDFSELYYQLINEMLKANPSIRVVAVGDDWQAINGFAGAQLMFFNRFSEYFPGAGATMISTNRRSGRSIVGAGNQLMEGRGEPALAHNVFDGSIDLVAVDEIRIEHKSAYREAAESARDDGRKTDNWELAKALKACSDYVVASVYPDSDGGRRWMPSVLILARTGRAYSVTLPDFGRRLQHVLRQHPDMQDLANDFASEIEVMTAHKSKGKEADTVIVLEAVLRQFPKVHADNQLFGLFGVTAEDVLAEERRLFYVAATRAEHRLMLLTETGKESPYLTPLKSMTLVGSPSEGEGKKMGAEAQAIKRHLDRTDQEALIRQNVSQQARAAWERLAGKSLGLPEVGYPLSDEIHAELAWPDHKPPIAILTGRHSARAAVCREKGWSIFC